MNQINLIPIKYKKRQQRRWYILFGSLGSIVVLIVLINLALIPVFGIKEAIKEQEILTEDLASAKILETKMIVEEVKVAKQKNSKAANELQELDVPAHITRLTMDSVVGSAPKGLRMNQVIMENKDQSIIIDGHAKDVNNVAQYIVQLYNTGQFDIVDYAISPKSDTTIPGWFDYNIRIKSKNSLSEEAAEETEEIEEIEEIEESEEEQGGGDIL